MVVAQFELAGRAHHAVRFDPADRGDAQHHAVGGHRRAGQPEHAGHAGARVGGAADDLDRAVAGVDAEHLQLVGLRVGPGAEHARDLEVGEFRGRVIDAFDLQPDAGQGIDDLVERGGGFEVLLEPAEGELHAPTPPLSVGTSSALKP